jgi:ABC-type uncharacterized transport system substrate-binding protein
MIKNISISDTTSAHPPSFIKAANVIKWEGHHLQSYKPQMRQSPFSADNQPLLMPPKIKWKSLVRIGQF